MRTTTSSPPRSLLDHGFPAQPLNLKLLALPSRSDFQLTYGYTTPERPIQYLHHQRIWMATKYSTYHLYAEGEGKDLLGKKDICKQILLAPPLSISHPTPHPRKKKSLFPLTVHHHHDDGDGY